MADPLGTTQSIDDRARRAPGDPTRVPQLFVLLECSRPAALSTRHALAGVAGVSLGRGADRACERVAREHGEELRITLPDRWMSSRHARIEPSYGRWVLDDRNSKNGSLVNGEPTHRVVLADGDLIELGHTLFLFRDGLPGYPGDARDLDAARLDAITPGLVTLVPGLARQFEKLAQIAASPVSVLLHGQSGTGKEVIARAVHALSRRTGPFVAVNCGAIPASLVESELFGHKRGAFSGAVDDHVGLIRSAAAGTLLLDEIGDLPAPSQAALLRVLQEREVTPVGATRPVPIDVRVVAATHRDLEAMVMAGSFRQDLYARLAGFRLVLPRLAERREDLGLLIAALHARATGERGHPGFEPAAVRALFRYPWPLDIRELEQVLTTAAVLAGDQPIALDHLPEHVREARPLLPVTPTSPPVILPAGSPASASQELHAEEAARRDELVALLRKHRGNLSAVARDLGKDRKQIQRWIKRYALRPAAYRC